MSSLLSHLLNSGAPLARILAHKIVALAILFGVGVYFLIIPAFTNQLGANPIERLLHVSGEIAIWTLGAVLSLTPLRVLFPRSALVNALNRHRRYIGVSACIYGLIHFSCHVLYQGDWDDLLQSFSKPFVWFGLLGLSILVFRTDQQRLVGPQARGKEMEAASPASLRSSDCFDLPSIDCRERPLVRRKMVAPHSGRP